MPDRLSSLLAGRRLPVFNASMSGAAGPELARAVSEAGGIGMIGVPSAPDPETLRRQAEALDGAVWGAGLIGFALEQDPAPLELVLDARPSVVEIGFGLPESIARRVTDSGIPLLVQIGTLEEAREAERLGADAVVARGSEGGGHGRDAVSTLPLLQQVLDDVDVDVIAAGGIAGARGLAAVLAAGAVAAWIGTLFVATAESQFSDAMRRRVIEADAGDTVYTRAFDIAQRAAWPPHYGGRALSNAFSDEWDGRINELERIAAGDKGMRRRMLDARAASELDLAPVYAGQAVGGVDAVRSVAEVMADLAGYCDHLRRALGA